ncbi:MAG: alpha/beta fold hydrolase [Betaproteobacteria bacterium]
MTALLRALVIAVVSLAGLSAPVAYAQIALQRTWPELKEAVQDRVNRNAYPLTGYDREEVREVLSRINSLDRDEWARSWVLQGEKHLAEARAAESSNPTKAREAYLAAWRYFGFGAWPTQNSEGKRAAHRRATEAFRGYARLAQPAIEVVRIPFEGKEIIGYLQLPAVRDGRPAPLVMSVGGLDSYKEYVAEQYGPGYLAAGLAYLALDMPGNGESSIMIDVGAERMYSRVLDYLATRKDIDPKRIGFMGVSWGGHWAARVGFTEKDRLRGSVVWGGPVDVYFSRDWQLKALGTREYLFELFAARASVYGANSLEEFLAYGPRMSLKTAGWLGKPSAPMLLVNGEKDSQVPIEDLYALLRNGSAKEAWVNPEGGHIGRNRDWPDTRIFSDVVVPWLARTLK